jgi:hypothetical protein
VAKTGRTRPATLEIARVRLRAGEAYLEVAELAREEPGRLEMPGVSAGIAVLAGTAASDAICASRLGQIHRGEDQRAVAALLEQATPDGKKLAATFLRLIDLKDEAHYGVLTISLQRGRTAVRWAQVLVDRARHEFER